MLLVYVGHLGTLFDEERRVYCEKFWGAVF